MPQNNFGGWQGGQAPYYPNNYPRAQNVVPAMPVEQKGITTITTASLTVMILISRNSGQE